jgi:chemotaxis protein MotB
MDDEAPHTEVIIVRRRGGHEPEHHGGAWKIAFADFMTAMMAFFLVMWIISATDKNTKTLIAHYFNPVKLEETQRTPKSIHTSPDRPTGPTEGEKTGDQEVEEARNEGPPSGKDTNQAGRPGLKAPAQAIDPANPKATVSEGVLFSDPYRSLDKIAGPSSPDVRAIERAEKMQDPSDEESAAVDAFRDPFRPTEPPAVAQTLDGGAPPAPAGTSPTPPATAGPATSPIATPAPTPTLAANLAPAPLPSVAATPTPTPTAVRQSLAAAAAQVQKELQLELGAKGINTIGPAIEVKATDEGLLISLTDNLRFSMFPIGSAEPQPQVVKAMDAVARVLKEHPGTIVVRGHTDAHPYHSATYDNWRLSSARAQMAYYMLSRAGVPENRFVRIEGYADRQLKDPAHPFDAENRRIEVLLTEPKS